MKLRTALLERAGEIYARRQPTCIWREPHEREGPEFRTAKVGYRGSVRRTRQHGPNASPAGDTCGNNSGEARCEGCSHQHGKRTFHAMSCCHGGRWQGSPRIIFKGKPFIPPSTAGRGKNTQPRKGSIAAEVLPANRTEFGYPVSGMSFSVREKSWCDARECTLWLSESWRFRPNHGSVIKQRHSILVLDDFRCHRSESFIEDLRRRTNTTVILIPGGLTPLLQPLDRMLNKEMKRLMRGRYTQYMALAIADPRTGKLQPPGRGLVSTWCKESWAGITPETVKMCFKVCGLTLALDGSEDDAWCTHNFGEGYREVLLQQRAEWEAQHPGVTLPPLQLPEMSSASGANPIATAEKEVTAKLLPPEGDSDDEVEIIDGDSDVELL
ncbi:unnamed protein product, partial [Ectocarpus sp. 12 AP-2014]